MSESPESPSQGLAIDRTDQERFEAGLCWAVDYRGDVTLRTTSGEDMECYVFDRSDIDGDELRCMSKGDDAPRSIPVSSIEEIRFSGKDTAEGKSFDRWIDRYVQKKLAGETASIDSESLDD